MLFQALTALAFCGSAAAQLGAPLAGGQISAANQVRVWIEDDNRASSYLNLFDLNYTAGPWLAGARFELDEEDRFDPEHLTDITRRFVEFRSDEVNLRAGNFYATFGRGLLLRAQEDEAVRLDRDIDGVYGAAQWRALDGQALIGRPRNDETHEHDDLISGAEFGFRVHPNLRLGGGYLRLDASVPSGTNTNGDDPDLGRPLEELAGANLQWTYGAIDASFEAASRQIHGMIDPRGGWMACPEDDGAAYYGSITAGIPGYTLLLEGKDYLHYAPPYATLPPANTAGQPVNEGFDERGFGLTLTASPRTEITMEGSAAWAGARGSVSERASADGFVRRDWWGQGAIKLGGEWTEETELESHTYRRWVGPTLDASYYLTPTVSLALHSKFFDWINHRRGLDDRDEYFESITDLTLSLGNSRAVTLSMIRATEPIAEYDGDDMWLAAQFAWAFGTDHDLTLKIGEERGGVVCSGGVCHYEPPFTGVRLELLSRF